jgi:hypothetical protein
MTSQELKDLCAEVNEIRLENPTVALAELRSVLSAITDHLYFRQFELERRES